MKVLYSCLSKSWGGMEMFALTAVSQLLKRNIETELMCYPGSRIHKEALDNNIKVLPLKAEGYFNPPAVLSLFMYLQSGKFDIVHTQASKDLWMLVPALKGAAAKTPLILTKQVGSFIIKKDALHHWIYNRVDLIFAISSVIKQNLVDTCPVNEDKIMLMHNGINMDKFDPAKANPAKIRSEFGIAEDELLIGMLARFSPGKGHEEFLQAAKQNLEHNKKLKFLIVGEASRGEEKYAESIRKMAEDMGIKDNVIFAGFRSDTPDVLAALDIFVFPSHAEALGIALIEALAMGRPSVCSASDGTLDVAVENETSLLFKKQDAEDLSGKLKMLIDSPELRQRFGLAARQRAVNHFDIEKLTDKTVEIYRSLIAE
ncbi:MAG TPA: glycosyltransferase family 4 protein [Ignavibacteriales bacterium]|nr:glycosyltransferase family 4 protein [Ignavibacteriales bacterium]